MKKDNEVIETGDGSSSLFNRQTGDNYHSKHGAQTESAYVFIRQGLDFLATEKKSIKILEVGLGTGLNAILSYNYGIRNRELNIVYHSLEPYPIDEEIIEKLHFPVLTKDIIKTAFQAIHSGEWNTGKSLAEGFEFCKYKTSLQEFETSTRYDLIYYDAFGPAYQPEMWEEGVFQKLAKYLESDGVLVSYCAQGQFRRNLVNAGFHIERLPGPPGKREMLRAIKL